MYEAKFNTIISEMSESPSMLPSTPPPELGCAQNSDRSLKDASEIQWFYDKDSTVPMSVEPAAEPAELAHSLPQPATFVAGARHSNRASRPSQRVRDMMDSAPSAGPSYTSLGKGKAGGRDAASASRHVLRKTVVLSGSEDSDDHGDGHDTDICDEGVQSAEYDSLKAMADADHEVSFLSFLFIYQSVSDYPYLFRLSFSKPEKILRPTSALYFVGRKKESILTPERFKMVIGAHSACVSLFCLVPIQ